MKTVDFILINGKIWTGNLSTPWVEAFASRDGVITATGSSEEISSLKTDSTNVFDAENRLVVPGFTDSHVHFILGGMSLLELDLSRVTNKLEFEKALRTKDRELPEGAWMCGSGWDHTKFVPPELPDADCIDAVCPHRPVFLIRQDMHTVLVNRKALELAGITKGTPDPEGGRIDREQVSGNPTGILREAAVQLVERAIPPNDESTTENAVKAACREASRNGVTTVHDITKLQDYGWCLSPLCDI